MALQFDWLLIGHTRQYTNITSDYCQRWVFWVSLEKFKLHVKANDYIQFKIAVHVVNHCTTSLCHVKRGSLKAVPLSTVLEGLRFGISIHPWYRGSWSCLNQVCENTCKTKEEIEWFNVYSVTSCNLQQIYIIVLYIALFSIHVTFVSAARIGSWNLTFKRIT